MLGAEAKSSAPQHSGELLFLELCGAIFNTYRPLCALYKYSSFPTDIKLPEE
jgi:hypothetical protein